MELHPTLKLTLEKINFLERYRELSTNYPFIDESLENYSYEKVNSILALKNSNFIYDKKENFFQLNESSSDLNFTFNISFKYGITELIWGITKNNQRLTIGGPWGLICDLLIKDDCGIKDPAFRNYEDLELILREAFIIYEDFKKEVINELSE